VAFKGEFPQVDHSWAVSKSDWSSSDFQVVEDAGELRLVGQSMQVRVEKSSSRIRFCDASGAVINQDAKPMMWDSKGARNAELFDPKSGPMVAATKDLGLEEHYYGFGEKSAKLGPAPQAFHHVELRHPGLPAWQGPDLSEHPLLPGTQRFEVLRNLL
jgi:hypothetical protein